MDGMCVQQVCISIYYYYHWYIHWGDKRKGMGVCLVYLVRMGVGYEIWLGAPSLVVAEIAKVERCGCDAMLCLRLDAGRCRL